MSKKHTPGPWLASSTAEIRSAGGKYIACVGDPNFIPRVDDEANARLIAAAPDLLAELEATAVWLEERADVVCKLGAGSHGKQAGSDGLVAAELEGVKLRGRAQLIRFIITKATD